MTFSLGQTILAIILVGHGAGHMLFFVPLVSAVDWDQSTDSWLLSRIGGCRFTQAVGAIIWLIATVAFLISAFGLIVGMDYWGPAAIIGSLVSILGIILFWEKRPTSPVIAALIVDIAILIAWAMGWLPASFPS